MLSLSHCFLRSSSSTAWNGRLRSVPNWAPSAFFLSSHGELILIWPPLRRSVRNVGGGLANKLQSNRAAPLRQRSSRQSSLQRRWVFLPPCGSFYPNRKIELCFAIL